MDVLTYVIPKIHNISNQLSKSLINKYIFLTNNIIYYI
ncbi:hypothetical protein ECHWP_0634 [Ehrlichia chaffeensis str. West Paces]|nr:hypothetical protein ECHWP_0634 [Ehrlichia chaffeensis str. West Paces]